MQLVLEALGTPVLPFFRSTFLDCWFFRHAGACGLVCLERVSARRRPWAPEGRLRQHLSYSLNSLKGGLYGGLYWRVLELLLKGDTRSSDYSSFGPFDGAVV